MVMNEELFNMLLKYNRITDCCFTIFNDDEWIYLKPSKNKGRAWFKNVEYNDIVEWAYNDISGISGMKLERWLEACNISPEGYLTYLEVNEPTDWNNDILGKKTFSFNGVELNNQMTLVLLQEKDPTIRNKQLKIQGVGTEQGIYFKRGKGRPRFTRELKN